MSETGKLAAILAIDVAGRLGLGNTEAGAALEMCIVSTPAAGPGISR